MRKSITLLRYILSGDDVTSESNKVQKNIDFKKLHV